MDTVRVTINDRIYQQNSLVWALSHNKLQPARATRYAGTNHHVHRITGKIRCSESQWNNCSVYWQTYPVLEGVILLKVTKTPTWIFHHLLYPSTSIPQSLAAIILAARDGMITFYIMTNMEINRHEQQLTLEGEANGRHWRYYFDHSPFLCLSLDIHTRRQL